MNEVIDARERFTRLNEHHANQKSKQARVKLNTCWRPYSLTQREPENLYPESEVVKAMERVQFRCYKECIALMDEFFKLAADVYKQTDDEIAQEVREQMEDWFRNSTRREMERRT